jgi:hypothetical protein
MARSNRTKSLRRFYGAALLAVSVIIVYMVVRCTMAGNESERFKTKPAGQDTPQAALEKGTLALLDGDYDSFDKIGRAHV